MSEALGFETHPTALPGCVELRLPRSKDARGGFIKLFHQGAFAELGLETTLTEAFCTTSRRDVIRGLHFQRPPHAHAKLVVCLDGAVQDVALDLRRNAPTYGGHAVVELSAEAGNALYLPAGLAHGFCVRSDAATVLYLTGTVHAPESDAGIAWDSAGIAWATEAPILSERDRHHPVLADFDSPFRFPEGT
ncbi:dTDP-4-keto-6-deoxy-D-glucose epimerase [Nitrogeniibacter mangrovi]|uniref:dTDP-4-dehydrorhamnose 3,5-epimerase n=1 Tax=Nitrogeniibacter mangrovi TaxID=2016596 RepID=A0A6C1B1U6_9RHOO|nr:dTDP-4-dehydrorhamnose 3,5-epimerase family protein [Nitrogeniibacter mangrovi]QID17333.1 dTDP-4-keto-6-deoxy-D-glucose epimerase [Nitrogeniibacter mangrovi]